LERKQDQSPLEYLSRTGRLGPTPSEQESKPPEPVTDLSSLQLFAARAVLQGVQDLESKHGQRGVKLLDCAREIGMAAAELLPLARGLATGGLLDTLESDAIGDDLVSLSPDGRDLLNKYDPRDLASRLTK
jgi:hypothetical protein